jgi:hypothetical protein
MKLQEITDLRVDQIREIEGKKYLIRQEGEMGCWLGGGIDDIYKDEVWWHEEDFLEGKIVGFLGITHKKEGTKLIEIPRDKFDVDDVLAIKSKDFNTYFKAIVFRQQKRYDPTDGRLDYYLCNIFKPFYDFFEGEEIRISTKYEGDYKKLGIFGVNYELISNKLVNKK